MASNSKDGSNYLDGVPVKISSKFLPPNPVTIPLALDTAFSNELLAEHYDFSFERKVIEHHTKRLQELIAAKAKPSKPADTQPSTSSSQQQPVDAPSKTAQYPWNSTTILQPSPQQPLLKSSGNPKRNDAKINLSDFENDTSSPFDYMELQTINDLEELSSVFQGISSRAGKEEVARDAPEEAAVSKSLSFPLAQNPWPEKIPCSFSENFSTRVDQEAGSSDSFVPREASQLSNDPVEASHGKEHTASGHFNNDPVPASHSKEPNAAGSYGNGRGHFTPDSDVASHGKESVATGHLTNDPHGKEPTAAGCYDNGPGHFTNDPTGPSHHSNGQSPFTNMLFASSRDTAGYSTLSQVPYIASNAVAPTVKYPSGKPVLGPGSSVLLRGSKSYSDISTLSDNEVMNASMCRSRTPPSFPVSQPITQEQLPFQDDHFEAPPVENSNSVCNSDTSDYEQLDDVSRRFVDSVTEMGFPQGQVSRAVKHLGVDEKKVVEHLCQIQALEESGYDSSEAEAALHLHDYNRDQAKEFLDLVNQFQDLGFEKDAVKKALVQNKNDWNKTIDALLP